MAAIKKRFSFKRDKINDSVPDSSFTDGPANTTQQKSPQRNKHFDRLPPDKPLETKVLQSCSEYLSTNLPPDDVAIEMNSKGLLTVKEHEEYLSMKRAHTSDSTKSEYLLQCLGRRKAGFLTRFCEILRGIEQASYLADYITEAYKRAALLMQGYNSRLSSHDRLSNLSLSDPDLHAKGAHYSTQECTRCKILERQKKKLEKQCLQFKEQQEVYQSIILPFTPLAEVAQEQLERALVQGNQLKKLLPLLQDAVTQTTSQISAVQLSLSKMNDMLAQEKKKAKEREKAGQSSRDSIISDGSAFTADGETDSIHIIRLESNHPVTTEPGAVGTDVHENNIMTKPTEEHQVESGKKVIQRQSTSCEEFPEIQRRKSESVSAAQKRKILPRLRNVHSNEDSRRANVDMEELNTILNQRRKKLEAASNSESNQS